MSQVTLPEAGAQRTPAVPKDSLTVIDNRTGKSYELPVDQGTFRAMDMRQIKTGPDDFGLMSYDPAFMNTASCRSRITFIDGDRGILRYRGYPIDQLAEKSTYLETAYLILSGELPTKAQHDEWVFDITHHTMVHENVKDLMMGFRYDAHPMGMLASTVAALSTFYPEAKQIHDPLVRRKQIHRLIAKIPTLAAFAYRHSKGLPYVYPDNELSFAGNFLSMMFKTTELRLPGQPGPGAGDGRALHPARRPRAELLHLGDAGGRLVVRRPLHRGRRRHRRPLRPAARRGQRAGPADARRHRLPGQGAGLRQGGEGVRGRGEADGLRAPGLQELRPAGQGHQGDGGPGLRGHREEPAARHRPGAREDRALRRVLPQAQALPERRLLLGAHLPGHGLPGRHVPGPLRDRAHVRLARPVGGDGAGQGAEDRAAAPGVTWARTSATSSRC